MASSESSMTSLDACSSADNDTSCVRVPSGSGASVISRMALNDNKAGMEGLDKEKINQIIYEASKGSKFYENEKKKEEQVNLKIQEQRALIEQITREKKNEGIREANKILEELEESIDFSHTIVHVDMDAFYAAVEMRDDPSLRHKPMAVGGKDMLSTSNYIARRFGVRAAMPGFIGLKLCPDLVIVRANFEKYTAVSKQIRQIMADYDPNFCPMSLDEAYLDFTVHLRNRAFTSAVERTFVLRQEENIVQESASTSSTSNEMTNLCACDLNDVIRPHLLDSEKFKEIIQSDSSMDFTDGAHFENVLSEYKNNPCIYCGKKLPHFHIKTYGVRVEDAVLEMRNRIQQRTHLTASAGIAPNTMLAKVCSDRNKPNGQYQIKPVKQDVLDFVENLPVRKISGIGKVSEKLLGALGVEVCSDLYKQRGLLYHLFSPTSFHYFMRIALGIGSTVVERDGERKSMSTEQTFHEIHEEEALLEKCSELSASLAKDMQDERLVGKTVTLKIKTVDFKIKTRSHTLQRSCNDEQRIFAAAKQLLKTEIEAEAPKALRLRLMGVRMSKLEPQGKSLTIAAMFQKQSMRKQAEGHSVGEESGMMPTVDVQVVDSDEEENFEVPFDATTHENKQAALNPSSPLTKSITSPGKQKRFTSLTKSEESSRSIESFFHEMTKCDHISKFVSSTSTKSHVTGISVVEKHISANYSEPVTIDLSEEDEQLEGNSLNFTAQQQTYDSETHSRQSSSSVGECSSTSTSSSSRSNDSLPDTKDVMIQCPVCLHQRQNWCLDQFNAHVDLCLSRQTIKDILQDQEKSQSSLPSVKPQTGNSSNRKRMRPELPSTSSQKRSKGVPNQRSVLSFFQR